VDEEAQGFHTALDALCSLSGSQRKKRPAPRKGGLSAIEAVQAKARLAKRRTSSGPAAKRAQAARWN